jgi:hypothetical protein
MPIQTENFSVELGDKIIVGTCTLMEKTCCIWFAQEGDCAMGASMALCPTKFEAMSTSTPLMDGGDDEAAQQCAAVGKKLSTFFKLPMYVSSPGIAEDDVMPLLRKLKEVLSCHYPRPQNLNRDTR